MTLRDAIDIIVYVNAIIVIILLIYEERDPSTTLAWAFALILFPFVGLVLYLVFGRNWRVIGRRDRARQIAFRCGLARMAPVYARFAERARAALADRPEFVRRVATAIERQNATEPLPCVDLEVFTSGAEKFARLFADVEAATDSIHLEYFIWEDDELTGRLCDLLAAKVRAGVEVRVLYDWVGSIGYSKRQLKALERAGARVEADSAHWTKLNYRNHRKIALIDGSIAYTGGMNLGQEYIDGKPRYASWRDTHLRLRGPLAGDLQRLFCQRWMRLTGEDLFTERYFPDLSAEVGEGAVWGQVAYSGSETQWQAVRNAFLLAILGASRRVRVQSPYFVPDESILEALRTQSLAGVDLAFMMTGVPDKRIAFDAAFSYIDELVEAGGRLYQYEAGFFHAKVLTVDGELAVIGTTNFDIRSFMLHDELSVFFYDAEVAAAQDAVFDADVASCRLIDLEHIERQSRLRRFRNAVARLWSRLL